MSLIDERMMSSFLHNIDLVFHEAGHVLFMPFGEFLTVLGGSLMQLIVPVVVSVVLLFEKRDPFGAALALWWIGQNLLDLAPYIGDARSLQLILLGGVTGADAPGYHDWENILRDLGLLQFDRRIALVAALTGRVLMALAILWGVLVLRECRKGRPVERGPVRR
jgi:hypothetical protein